MWRSVESARSSVMLIMHPPWEATQHILPMAICVVGYGYIYIRFHLQMFMSSSYWFLLTISQSGLKSSRLQRLQLNRCRSSLGKRWSTDMNCHSPHLLTTERNSLTRGMNNSWHQPFGVIGWTPSTKWESRSVK